MWYKPSLYNTSRHYLMPVDYPFLECVEYVDDGSCEWIYMDDESYILFKNGFDLTEYELAVMSSDVVSSIEASIDFGTTLASKMIQLVSSRNSTLVILGVQLDIPLIISTLWTMKSIMEQGALQLALDRLIELRPMFTTHDEICSELINDLTVFLG